MLEFGRYPTPVSLLPSLSRPGCALWVKQDDRTNPTYGGNKVRKIGPLLQDAQRHGKDTVVTVGAVGSHHLLTTGIFGRSVGIVVEGVVVRQPRTAHVLENLRADVGQGVRLFPASSYLHAALLVSGRVARGAYYIPAGGSNIIGASAYVAAASELAAQIREGRLPEPDLLVVALGSGGTAAGLAAGLAREGLRTRVLAVTVASPPFLVEQTCRQLAARCAGRGLRKDVLTKLELTRTYLGAGYGHCTEAGQRATRAASNVGLTLDPTYTAKAFAAALDAVTRGRGANILYWHTLSSAAMPPLLTNAPPESTLDPRLLKLATGPLHSCDAPRSEKPSG